MTNLRVRLRYALILLLLLLFIVVIVKQRKPSADVDISSGTSDPIAKAVEAATTPRALFASACTKQEAESGSIKCRDVGITVGQHILPSMGEVGSSEFPRVYNEVTGKIDKKMSIKVKEKLLRECAYAYFQLDAPGETTRPLAEECSNNGINYGSIIQQPESGEGVIDGKRIKWTEIDIQIPLEDLGDQVDNYTLVYDDKQNYVNVAKETIKASWSAKATYRIEFVLLQELDDVGNIVNNDYQVKTNMAMGQIDIHEGSYIGGYNVDLNAKEDLDDSFSIYDTKDSRLKVDLEQSSWELKTKGTLGGKIDLSWKSDENDKRIFTVNDYQLCQETCEISIAEDRTMIADYIDQAASIGKISEFNHSQEIRKGTMTVINNKLAWNDDLEITTFSTHKWNQNFTNKPSWAGNGAGKEFSSAGFLSGDSFNKPQLNQHKYNVSLRMEMNFADPTPAETAEGSTSEQLVPIKISSDIKSILENGVTTTTGTGSVSNGNSLVSGIYDNIDLHSLRVNDINGNLTNTYINPFENKPDFLTEDGVQDHLPGEVQLGGTIPTLLRTAKVKLLPANIVVINAMAINDPTITADYQKKDKEVMDRFVTAVSKKGVTVNEVIVNTKEELLAAFGALPNNVWVILNGHGLPTGVSAGSSGDVVSYEDIQNMLDSKGIKISVYSSSACFSGHATLSDVVVGSIGVGLSTDGNEDDLQLSELMGLGGNSFNYTTGDMIRVLNGLLEGCSGSNQNTAPVLDLSEVSVAPKDTPEDTSGLRFAESRPTNTTDGSATVPDSATIQANLTDYFDNKIQDVFGSLPWEDGVDAPSLTLVHSLMELVSNQLCTNPINNSCPDPNKDITQDRAIALSSSLRAIQAKYPSDSAQYKLISLLAVKVNEAYTSINNSGPLTSEGTAADFTSVLASLMLNSLNIDAVYAMQHTVYEPGKAVLRTEPTELLQYYDPAIEIPAEQVWYSEYNADVAAAESLPVLSELPYYAPKPEYSPIESFSNDIFNFEPDPMFYYDPYIESYNETLSSDTSSESSIVVPEQYIYQPAAEPLFNDWYDYVTPMDYLDYSYDVFVSVVESVTDWAYSFGSQE